MLELLALSPILFVTSVIGLLLSLTIHEFAHAWMAEQLGDTTPRSQGRVTLNPLAHLDPVGTLLLLFTRFGWGKPVQINPHNFDHPRQDEAKVALAGPISNLLLAGVCMLVMRSGAVQMPAVAYTLVQITLINIVLAVFNLIPIYPLDGSKVLHAILPRDLAIEYEDFMERYGMYILIAIIFPFFGGRSVVSYIMSPVIDLIFGLLMPM